MSDQEKLRAALAHAAAGLPVFWCKPGSKQPATSRGFKDATSDAERITRVWTACPDLNPAVPTGAPGPDVLDVDVRADGNGFGALNRLKRAGLLAGARALVRTPSSGLHIYFAGTDQQSGACRCITWTSRAGAATSWFRRPWSAGSRTNCSTTVTAMPGWTGPRSGVC